MVWMCTELFDVFDGQEMSTPQDSQTLDKDLKAAGELLRDHNLTKFTNNINCNFKDDGVSPTHRTPRKPKLSPQDMLALAITSKLEADAESARAEAAATAARVVHEQQAAEAAAHKTVREYSIAMFRNIEEIVQLIGVTCPETQQQYCTALTTNGFETLTFYGTRALCILLLFCICAKRLFVRGQHTWCTVPSMNPKHFSTAPLLLVLMESW